MEASEDIKKLAVERARRILTTLTTEPKAAPDLLLVAGFIRAAAQSHTNPVAALATVATALEICRRFGGGEVFEKPAEGGETQTLTA